MGFVSQMSSFLSARREGGLAGTSNKETATRYTTPWMCRDEDGLYGGLNREAWLYWQLPINPLLWEDPNTRLDHGQALQGLITDLGDLELDQSVVVPLLSNQREIHIVSLTWEEPGSPSASAEGDLAEFQAACLDFLIPHKAVVVGVKLRSENAILTARYKGVKGLVEQLRETGTKALGETGFDRSLFATDRARVEKIFRRHGAKPPESKVLNQLESWYNLGRGPDCLIQVADDVLYIDDFDRIELAAVQRFDRKMLEAPEDQWLLDAATHPNGPHVVSIRAQLQTPSKARNRARGNQRKMRAQMEEEMATGDLERIEDTMAFEQAQETEQFITLGRECLLSSCSIVLARRVSLDAQETYADDLRQTYGIEVRPMLIRQLEALEETLPCSSRRVNPFLQDLSISMVSYSGILGWSNLGDREGLFLGLADPDFTPVWLDTTAAPAENKPPAFCIFGDPGSGKAQPLDAKVLTPTGWKLMGDVSVGDRLVSVDGKPTKVLAVYPQGVREIVTVTFDDGVSVECDWEHLWTLAPVDDRSNWSTMSAAELAVQLAAGNSFVVPTVAPVEFTTSRLPVDPYLFGVDLGAVRFDAGEFDDVLFAPLDVRAVVLQGLCDRWAVAGERMLTVEVDARCGQMVVDLVRSLGGVARCSFDYDDLTVRVAVALPESVSPFRTGSSDLFGMPAVPVRRVVSVEASGSKPAQCVLVDHPSHLYVTDGFVVTHNTYLCQLLATQAALDGKQVIFINPKAFSTLKPFADLVDGQVVKMSELEDERSGFFDPFRFADPEMAAEVATNFILQVLGNTGVQGMGFTAEQELHLGSGLKRGARAGARCVVDALAYVEDASVRDMIDRQLESSALFRIGISSTPTASYQASRGLTLIEFDRKLDFPEPGKPPSTWSRNERISLAAVRLVTRASLEILVGSGGGVLVVDEAWTFLSSSEGLATLQQIGREGRSQNLLPIFATQRVNDLIRDGVDMEGYMSRVMVMKLNDPREARAAYSLCGLEPTEARVRWLSAAGPRPAQDGMPARPAMGIFRDINKRHAPVYVGPIPPVAHVAFTTNPKERKVIDDLAASQQVSASAGSVVEDRDTFEKGPERPVSLSEVRYPQPVQASVPPPPPAPPPPPPPPPPPSGVAQGVAPAAQVSSGQVFNQQSLPAPASETRPTVAASPRLEEPLSESSVRGLDDLFG
jgi:hypothetical protein